MAMEIVTGKVELKVSGKRLWKAAFENNSSVLPKASPHVIEKVVEEGDGFKPGAIYTIHFHRSFSEKKAKENNGQHIILYTKEKLLEVDHNALSLKAEVIEGGFLGVIMKRYTNCFRVEEVGPNACVLHWTIQYEALSEAHKAHIPHVLKESIAEAFSAVEAFLLSHHHDYN